MKHNRAQKQRLRGLSAVLLLLLFVLACWTPAGFVRHAIPHRRDAVQAACDTILWCERRGFNRKLCECFEENMQTDASPLVRIMQHMRFPCLRGSWVLNAPFKLCSCPLYVREADLNIFAQRMTSRMQRPTVAYCSLQKWHRSKAVGAFDRIGGLFFFRALRFWWC